MVRPAAQLRAEAIATGWMDGPHLVYQGDGYSIPYQVATTAGLLSLGLSMYAFKFYLDSNYPSYARLHDWLYTPYGSLISVTQEEADLALREELRQNDVISAEVVYQACSTFGHWYFGTSQTGYVGGVPSAPIGNMPVVGTEGPGSQGMSTKIVILFQQTTTVPEGNTPSLNYTAVTRTAGWSESIYGPDSLQSVVTMLKGPRPAPVTGGLLPGRAACLSAAGSIVGVRLYAGGSGKGQLLNVSYKGTGQAGDIPSMGVLVSAFDATSGHSRRWMLRGMPDGQIQNGEFAPDDSFRTRLQNYFVALQGFSWKYNTFTSPRVIHDISAAGLVTTTTAHGYALGTFVTIKRTLQLSTRRQIGFTGQVTAAPSLTSFTIANWVAGACEGGTVGIAGIGDSTIDATTVMSAVRASTRHVGRPFVAYRGRKSSRRSNP